MSYLQRLFVSAFVVGAMVGTAQASDVYIEQAGSSSTIDITQTGNGNRVGSVTEATTINGSNTDIDITQTGTMNEFDLETATGASGSDIEATFNGGSNIMDIDLGGVSDTIINADITGDSNDISICGTMTAGTALAAATCSGVMSQDDIGIDIDVVGDSNKIGVARSGVAGTAGATEVTIDIGYTAGTTGNSNNVVNVTQSSATESGIVSLQMDGSSNVVNITQQ
jgi:hypothetical protein